MISGQIVIADSDARQWINLLSLFAVGRQTSIPSILLCILDGERCVKAWHSVKGPLWGFPFPGRDRLEEAREAAGADYVLCLPRGGLQEVFYHAQSAVAPYDNYVKQLFDLINAGREALEHLAVWRPAKPFVPPLPPYAKLEKQFRKRWPDGTTLGLFVFEGRRVFTSAILGKEHGEITLFTTLDAFGLGEQAMEGPVRWRTLAGMIAERFAPLYAALFIELPTLREMRAGPKPLTFLRLAEKRGRALVYPKPLLLRLALWAGRRFRGL
jgi:hypothetical protein